MAESNHDDTHRLIDFLRERDAPCPLCGYNLRDLATNVCPECQHELTLSVGLRHVRFGWFLATATPSLFSGIAAAALFILWMAATAAGAGSPPPPIYLLVAFGFASGVVGMGLIVRRHRFIELPPAVQRNWAIVTWTLHGLPFLGLVVLTIVTA